MRAALHHLVGLGVGAVISGDIYGWQYGLAGGVGGLFICLGLATLENAFKQQYYMNYTKGSWTGLSHSFFCRTRRRTPVPPHNPPHFCLSK